MSWNYRLVRRYYECPIDKVEQSYLAMSEVYYHDKKSVRPRAFTERLQAPTAVESETADPVGDIRLILQRQLEALEKPILDERKDFGGVL